MEKYQTNVLISLKFYGINLELAAYLVNGENVLNTINVSSCRHDKDRTEKFETTEEAFKRFKELISGVEIKSGFFKGL